MNSNQETALLNANIKLMDTNKMLKQDVIEIKERLSKVQEKLELMKKISGVEEIVELIDDCNAIIRGEYYDW